MPTLMRVDPGVQRLEFQHALAVEIQPGAPLVFGKQRFDIAQSRADHVAHGQVHRLGQRLREFADDEILTTDDFTAVRFEFPGDQLQRRGLSGAVSADQADPLAGVDGKLGLGEDLQVAKIEGHFIEAK